MGAGPRPPSRLVVLVGTAFVCACGAIPIFLRRGKRYETMADKVAEQQAAAKQEALKKAEP